MKSDTTLNRQQALKKYPFLEKLISGEMIMPSVRLIKLFSKKKKITFTDSGLDTRIPETVDVLLTEKTGVLPLDYRPTTEECDLEGVYFFGEKGEDLSGITWERAYEEWNSILSYFDFFGSKKRNFFPYSSSEPLPPAFAALVKISRAHIRIALYSKIDEGAR